MDKKKEPETSDSPLERLRKRVYGTEELNTLYRARLKVEEPTAPEHWKEAPDPLLGAAKKRMSGATLFLIGAGAFFAIALLATAVVLFLGGRSVSSDNIDVLVEGPTTVAGGEIASFFITVRNDNPVAVTASELSITFPEGVTNADAEDLRSEIKDLGTIAPGASVRTSIRASFLGEEGQQFTVPLSLEYQTEGSNATGVKKRSYDVLLGTAPMSLNVDVLSETSAGQQFTLTLSVRSNVASSLQNVAVKADYPTGFSVVTAVPPPGPGGTFSLGSFAPGEEKRMTITGALSGVQGDERVFSFTVGTLSGTSTTAFAVPYATHQSAVRIAEPFIAVNLTLNQETGATYIGKAGEQIQGLLSWRNALSVPILEGAIAVAIIGNAIPNSGVDAVGGFYRSADRTILFNPETAVELMRLEPGETGSGVFTLVPLAPEAMKALRNPSVTLALSVTGRRVGEGNVTETVTSTMTRTIKIQSDLTLGTEALRSIGPFTNTGPWPPVADTESTYTIKLMAGNTVNAVANGTVKMTLPTYVRYTGKTSGGTFSYNETSREVSWNIGDFPAGSSREAYFQVALLPSTSQKGTTPVLVSNTSIAGFDRFVQKQVGETAPDTNTQTITDPAYDINKGQVN